MNYLAITFPDLNNGSGCRVTLWVAGCPHHCKGCQNPESWNFKAGKEFTEEIKNYLFECLNNDYIKGLTLSGGDPLGSYKDILALVKEVKAKFPDKNIWLYTGYYLDEVQRYYMDILDYIDTIVDGRYIEDLRNVSLPFRGSTNQHIYDKICNEFIKRIDEDTNNT